MPLPDDFSEAEHLFAQIKAFHNLQVDRYFTGVEREDISTFAGSQFQACLIKDDDTMEMLNTRLFLYHYKIRGDLPTPVYGIPIPDFQAQFTFRPQVRLFFIEPYTQELAAEKLNQASAQISFRLMNETSQTIDRQKATVIAERIKVLFGEGTGFSFMKGRNKYTYVEKSHGYNLSVLAELEAEAVSLLQRVLEINEHPLNEELIKTHIDKFPYPNNPGTWEVYGIQAKKPRKKPTTRVRFQRAELHVHGLDHAISLVDLSRKTTPLIS